MDSVRRSKNSSVSLSFLDRCGTVMKDSGGKPKKEGPKEEEKVVGPSSQGPAKAMPSSEGTFSYRCPVGHQVKSRKALVEGLYIEMQKVDKDIAAIWVSNDAGVEMDPDDVKITVQNKATHEFVMKMGNRFPVTWTDSYVVLVCGVPRLRIDSARQHTLVFM